MAPVNETPLAALPLSWTWPSWNSTSSMDALASGDSFMSAAIFSTCLATDWQAPMTAEPTLVTVQLPPSTGLVGRTESPRRKVTRSTGTPSVSAAIMVITV